MMHIYPIYVVDGDRNARVAISNLLRTSGWQSRSFADGQDFLASEGELKPGIILLLQPQGISSALAFMNALQEQEINWPVIILTEGIAVSQAVAAMKLGALDVLERPVDSTTLDGALDAAVAKLDLHLKASASLQQARSLIGGLSGREIEVLRCLLAGYSNRTIAEITGLSVRTVEMHRGRILDRLSVESIVGAIRMALEAGLEPLHKSAA